MEPHKRKRFPGTHNSGSVSGLSGGDAQHLGNDTSASEAVALTVMWMNNVVIAAEPSETPNSSASRPPARPVTDQKSKRDSHECGGADQNVSVDEQRPSAAPGNQRRRLGLKLISRADEVGAFVSNKPTSSVLAGRVNSGDRIVKIDGVDVSRMDAKRVKEIMNGKSNAERVLLTFSRLENLAVKKPPSAHNLYVKYRRNQYISAHPNVKQQSPGGEWWKSIHRAICEDWRSLSANEKKPYEELEVALRNAFFVAQAKQGEHLESQSPNLGTSASPVMTAATSSSSSVEPSATPSSSTSRPPARPVTDQKSKGDSHECGGADQNVSVDEQRTSAVADGDHSKASPSHAKKIPEKRKKPPEESIGSSQSKKTKQSCGKEREGDVTIQDDRAVRSTQMSGESQQPLVVDRASVDQPKSGENGNDETVASTKSGCAGSSSTYSVLAGEASIRDKLDFCQMSLHPSYKKSLLTKSADLSNLSQNEDSIMEQYTVPR